ncbi:MAG: ABC transporter permease [Chloroflexi bacterium]|nr:ABC transporter permease [Chloroflexota bacterium]
MAVQDSALQPELESGRPSALFRAANAARNGLALILRTNTGRVAFAIVLVHLIVAIIGPSITPYKPTTYDLDYRFGAPNAEHWLGTDDKGRDVLSRVLAGSRSIVIIATLGTILGVTLGTIVGVTSGYFGGKTDQIIMRFVDWFLAIPSLLLAILVINMSRQWFTYLDLDELWLVKILTIGISFEAWLVIFTIGISFMPNNSRVIRSAALAIKPLEFVQSARLRGEPTIYIMFREILPNVLPVVAVEAAIRLSFALLLTAGLGFLGLGVQPPSSDWGLMVSENFRHIGQVPLAALAPGLAMASLVVGINLLADGIRQAQNLPETGE